MKNKLLLFSVLISSAISAIGTGIILSKKKEKPIVGNLHIQKDVNGEVESMYLEVLVPINELAKHKHAHFKVYTETYLEDSSIKIPDA